MPALQVHMLRVAAVAKIICENIKKEIDCEDIVTACLFHDVGNIIKFDLSYDPKLLVPHTREYWEKVKDGFINKYGTDERMASIKIARDCNVKSSVLDMIGSVGFIQSKETLQSKNLGKMICLYSDSRVTPNGVVSIEDRFLEGMRRHMKNKMKSDLDLALHDEYAGYIRQIESEIFKNAKIRPEDITNEKVKSLMDSPFLVQF